MVGGLYTLEWLLLATEYSVVSDKVAKKRQMATDLKPLKVQSRKPLNNNYAPTAPTFARPVQFNTIYI